MSPRPVLLPVALVTLGRVFTQAGASLARGLFQVAGQPAPGSRVRLVIVHETPSRRQAVAIIAASLGATAFIARSKPSAA